MPLIPEPLIYCSCKSQIRVYCTKYFFEIGREQGCEWIRKGSTCMHRCTALFLELLQILELAEEDGIVRIRRGDFTKRRLPVCNSFWRPWNCYSEKFSSCNSSTESPQIGRIQPPYNHPQHPLPPPPPLPRLSEAWLHESRVGLWMQLFGFCEFCSS